MNLQALSRCGRQPPVPATLALDGDGLRIERWLRVLPGRRYVGVACWQGRPVLAKLCVGRRAARQYRQELQGAQLLAEQGIPAPELLASGLDAEGGWLLFEFLSEAKSLGDIWSATEAPASRQLLLDQAFVLAGQLHARGLWQDDLHLDNLLLQGQTLYLVDGGGVHARTPGQPLDARQAARNLGVLLAQLEPEAAQGLESRLQRSHQAVDGAPAVSSADVLRAMQRTRRWRIRDYLRKAGRDCSLFQVRRSLTQVSSVRREASDALQPLLLDPDALLQTGHLYKTGGAATVVRVELDGRPLVIKRYNIKHWRHWLSRCWRPTRAWHSWLEGHRLELLGIPVVRNLAVIERRCWVLRREAWLVCDYLDAQDCLQVLAPYVDQPLPDVFLEPLLKLFEALILNRISHGDLKGNNLFWEAGPTGGRWVLIDLDAVCQHASAEGFRRAHARDRARFLRNWPEDSLLHQTLSRKLPVHHAGP